MGQKVAIVADKPQTTRTSIQGVVTRARGADRVPRYARHSQGRYAVEQAPDGHGARSARRARPAAVRGRCRAPGGNEDRRAVDIWRARARRPVVLVLNKIDLVKEKAAPAAADRGVQAPSYDFADYVPVSASRGAWHRGAAKGDPRTAARGPAYFPEDHITDQPERFLAAELVREKVLAATRQEVPHSVAVTVDQLGRDAGADAHLRHHPRGTRRAEGHRDRNQGRHAEADRHAGARRKWSACSA